MLRRVLLCVAVLLPGVLFAQKQYGVLSPDGRLCLQVTVAESLSYTHSYDGDCLVADSRIAVRTGTVEYGKNFRIRKAARRHIDEVFPTPVYKRSFERDLCNELRLVGRDGYDLVLRAYDDGAAWRFVPTGKKDVTVYSETVEFNLGQDRYAYIPYVKKTGDFDKQFFNTFENVYAHTPVSEWRKGQLAFLPVLVEMQAGKKICITESGLANYPGMYLLGDGSSTLRGVFAPYPKKMRQGSHDPSVTIGGHN